MLINILTIYTTLVNESVVDAATALLLYYQIKQRKNLIMICRFVLAPIMAIDAAGNSFVKSVLIRSFFNKLPYVHSKIYFMETEDIICFKILLFHSLT